jgi:hypothetical protein
MKMLAIIQLLLTKRKRDMCQKVLDARRNTLADNAKLEVNILLVSRAHVVRGANAACGIEAAFKMQDTRQKSQYFKPAPGEKRHVFFSTGSPRLRGARARRDLHGGGSVDRPKKNAGT